MVYLFFMLKNHQILPEYKIYAKHVFVKHYVPGGNKFQKNYMSFVF